MLRKRCFPWFLCLTLLAGGLLLSCKKESAHQDTPTVKVEAVVDWSQTSLQPTGMTLLFYPHSAGQRPLAVQTAEVSHVEVELAAGIYDVLVFNQIPEEFTHQRFSGLASLQTAQTRLQPLAQQPSASSLFPRAAEGELVSEEPEYLAVGLREAYQAGSGSILHLTPHAIVYPLTVQVHVGGIWNLHSVQASLYGLAGGYRLGQFRTDSVPTCHQITRWTASLDAGDTSAGTITAQLWTFGMPEPSRRQPADLHLALRIMLRDLQTIHEYHYDVGALLRQDVSTDTLRLLLDGTTATAPDPLPQLPDVQAQDGSSGGFQADVAPWSSGDTAVSYM